MKKALTLNDCEMIYNNFAKDWAEVMPQIKLSTSSLYSLISFKKFIESKHTEIQETVYSIMRAHGAEEREDGILVAPPEENNAINKEIYELSNEEVEVEIKPIKIKEGDTLPVNLLDMLFDFIEFEE